MKRLSYDLSDKTFGHLKTIGRVGEGMPSHTLWECQCECGRRVIVRAHNLTNGNTRSCGCLQRRGAAEHCRQMATHGMKNTPEYRTWHGMRQRCYNPRATAFRYYGARGIKVCERWKAFENFYADMGPRPSANHSIDRIDSDGNYEPENCRWTTITEQNDNKTSKVLISYLNRQMTLREALRLSGNVVKYETARRRLKWGWAVNVAVETPATKTSGRRAA